MKPQLEERLTDFAKKRRIKGKGALSVVLVGTRKAREKGLPLDPSTLLTKKKGQVAGLGKSSVQAILKDYGIERVLAEEGGRTSRGSYDNMREYILFLNELHRDNLDNLAAIERWWVDRVMSFFAGKPFILRLDLSKSLQEIFQDLFNQAMKRQQEESGTMYLAAVLQHLVGAKLDIIFTGIKHYGFSVADEGAARPADFLLGDTAIHVTTSPSEALIRKCEVNIGQGLHPIILTVGQGVVVAQSLAEPKGLADRIDILNIEQFLCGNIHEHGLFESDGRKDTVNRLVEKYNEVIDKNETDPSLRIVIGK